MLGPSFIVVMNVGFGVTLREVGVVSSPIGVRYFMSLGELRLDGIQLTQV
jgi:hypothetical protein